MTVLSLDGVSKMRGKGLRNIQALRQVSLRVAAGDILLLEGPSGAGKTTLLAVAAGLLRPDEGSVQVEGVRISHVSAEERRAVRARRIGFVFQRANLLGRLSVWENVLLMARVAGLSDRAPHATAEVLDLLGVTPLSARKPDELSGGEEQLVAVARALVHRPGLLLADEPTASLDWRTARVVLQALTRAAPVQSGGVVIATHDGRLRPFTSRHARISDGRVLD